MKGVYKHGEGWRVRKFNKHIGTFSTYAEAVSVALDSEDKHTINAMWDKYLSAKKWLDERGLLKARSS